MSDLTVQRLRNLHSIAVSAVGANDPRNMQVVLQMIADTLSRIVNATPDEFRVNKLAAPALLAYDTALCGKPGTTGDRFNAMCKALESALAKVAEYDTQG